VRNNQNVIPNGFRKLKRALPATHIFIAPGRMMSLIEQPPESTAEIEQNKIMPNAEPNSKPH
jgi:hypothetical protein